MFKDRKSEWWKDYFDNTYLKTYIDLCSQKSTQRQVDFIMRRMGLKRGSRILDLGCGYGRHAISLAKKGIEVTAFDYSEDLLRLAKKEARRQQVSIQCVRGDMRHLHFKHRFDGVISMFTSFGYFDNFQDNLLVIKGVSRALTKKGLFLIDLNNPASIIRSFILRANINKRNGFYTRFQNILLSNGLAVKMKLELDLQQLHLFITRRWRDENKIFVSRARVNIITLPELSLMFAHGNLRVQRTWGSFDGSPFQCSSPRMIVLGEKQSVK